MSPPTRLYSPGPGSREARDWIQSISVMGRDAENLPPCFRKGHF